MSGGPAVAALLGALQGATEFLPISSSGHLAAAQLLAPGLSYPGLTMELGLHVGTTAAVLIYYRRLVTHLLLGTAYRPVRAEDDTETGPLFDLDRGRWLMILLYGTMATAAVGLLAQSAIRQAFDSPRWIAAGWVMTGVVLFASRWRSLRGAPLSTPVAIAIGAAQGLAAFPGLSRSGVTITLALLLGIRREQAVAFSLLLSIPTVAGAVILDAVQTLAESATPPLLFIDLSVATITAGLVGYFCIGWVRRATHANRWHAFAWYCWLAAIAFLMAVR